jgi:hypothetical protein
MSEHTPTPWTYRTQEYDDWGFIRGPKGSDGFAPVAAIARGETSETRDAHRKAGTDPYGPNASFIVKAVNNHEALVKALTEMCEAFEFGVDQKSPVVVEARGLLASVSGSGKP